MQTDIPHKAETFDWCGHALAGNLIVDLGQLDKSTVSSLNRLVREGRLARCRGSWSRLLMGPPKTIWAAPHALWAPGQFDRFLEVHPEFMSALDGGSALNEAA